MKTYLVYLHGLDEPIEITGKAVASGNNLGFVGEDNEPVAVFNPASLIYFILKQDKPE